MNVQPKLVPTTFELVSYYETREIPVVLSKHYVNTLIKLCDIDV